MNKPQRSTYRTDCMMTPLNETIQRAAGVLEQGGLVAFPTETVYGLGADATNAAAVRRIFAAKGRPANHPLIVHFRHISDLRKWAREIPAVAWHLADAFWPGPLTLILKRNPQVLDTVTGGLDTVGLRVPNHPVALDLLSVFGGGLAAPSANRFGRVSPTTADHVRDEFGDRLDDVIDGGPCCVGLESTILDLSGTHPKLLRPGAITPEMLAPILGTLPGTADSSAPRAPGTLASHYAPYTPVLLVEPEQLTSYLHTFKGQSVAVLALRSRPAGSIQLWRSMPLTPESYGYRLYASLREADELGCQWILVEMPPSTSDWDAPRDRLRRAATGHNKAIAACL